MRRREKQIEIDLQEAYTLLKCIIALYKQITGGFHGNNLKMH